MHTIGIMAGSGQFPLLVARSAKAQGHRVVICGFYDNADPALAAYADEFIMLHLGRLGDLIKFLKKNEVTKACMAGAISKPKAITDIKPDLRVTKLMFKLAGKAKGDDAILRAVAEEMQNEGINIMPPDELVPGLHVKPGILGRHAPAPEIWQDIRYGWRIAKEVGALDIGQCVIVHNGMVVAVEGMEGTDKTLQRGRKYGGKGCTAVKVVKPGQDTRLDLPSICASTLELLAELDYACLAFEAGGTLFFDSDQALDIAGKNNICVVAVPDDAERFFNNLSSK